MLSYLEDLYILLMLLSSVGKNIEKFNKLLILCV